MFNTSLFKHQDVTEQGEILMAWEAPGLWDQM